MARTENEQELVLGNKQLLSAFFVVVALLGVFFTMGYVIGRNTTSTEPQPKRSALTDRPPDPAPAPSAATETVPPPVAAIPQRTEPSHVQDPVRTEPARTEPAPKPVAKAEEPPPKPEPKKPAPAPAAEESAPLAASTTAGHTYLQVMAVKRPVADNTVKMLKGRGFPALLGESSKPELFRVLVGPYSDTESLATAKTALKKMGFDTFVSK
jgi:cell division septation protein DedD